LASKRLAAAAVALSYLVLFNTLLVTVHNLGARDDIGYINGGKVFRLTGTMWYHIPGLQEIGLAPQNIGGQINLRNNEFAMLERDLRSVSRIEVDFGLAPDAMMMVVLDRHREGAFWAVRLTAFESEKSPFVNALLRFEKGRVVKRVPLPELGRTLEPGEHSATVELTGDGQLIATVDGASQAVPFEVHSLKPKLALACGERNTTILKWRVSGVDEDGQPFEWAEEFSIMRSLDRRFGALVVLTTLAWLILLGLPIAKVVVETRSNPLEVAVGALLKPMPRWIFGLVCLVPVMPMLLQWILGGLYVMYALITLWDALAEGRHAWLIAEPGTEVSGSRPRLRWLAAAAVIGLVGVGLMGGRYALYGQVIGSEPSKERGKSLATAPGMRRLGLGERVALELAGGSVGGDVRVRFRTKLGERDVLRADLLRGAPPTRADVYQVDRSQDKAEGQEEEENQGPGDYSLQAASVIISADPDLPGQLRRLHADKAELSPHMGWVLEPGEHSVEITAGGRVVSVAVDGVVRDFRADMPRGWSVGAVQLLSMSAEVTAAGDVDVQSVQDALADTRSSVFWADLLGLLAAALIVLALVLLVIAAASRVAWSRATALLALRKGLRGHLLLWLWLAWWLMERLEVVHWAGERVQLFVGAVCVFAGAFNLAQLLRQSQGARSVLHRSAAMAVVVVFGILSFEGLSWLYPERRFNWTHYWHNQLGPSYYYVHDPMIRRLNPWFIDQRFKRRDFLPAHPGKTRVVVFGGSQTYGWGIPAMDRMAFSDQLERALHRRGHKEIEVLNAAFPGVKTATGLRWFSSNLLRYEPDIVVINFVVNEFMNVDQFLVWSGETPSDSIVSPLAAGALLERWRGDLMGNHLSQIIVADVYETYAMEQYLRWWVDIANKHGVKVVFSIEPTNLYVESGGEVIMREETTAKAAQQVYRDLSKELGVPVYDVLPFFVQEQENIWFYDTMHMSRLGHRVFAENLAALIERELLTEQVGLK